MASVDSDHVVVVFCRRRGVHELDRQLHAVRNKCRRQLPQPAFDPALGHVLAVDIEVSHSQVVIRQQERIASTRDVTLMLGRHIRGEVPGFRQPR
jgi:hypothetical protein